MYQDVRLQTVLKRSWIILERLPSVTPSNLQYSYPYYSSSYPLASHVPNAAPLTGIDFRSGQAFALEEMLLHQVHWRNGVGHPIVHIWQGGPSVILGYQDTRLPLIERALYALLEQGFSFFVRPSGGRLVVLDEGVLNIGMILPERSLRSVSLKETFLWMANWLARALHLLGFPVHIGEVHGSYCPGQYDVAIYGPFDEQTHPIKKVAGIAQRRVESGVLLTAFLNMHACKPSRGEIARLFYRLASKETEDQRHTIPAPSVSPATPSAKNGIDIDPSTITSLYLNPVDHYKKQDLRQTVLSALLNVLKEETHASVQHHIYRDDDALGVIKKLDAKDDPETESTIVQSDDIVPGDDIDIRHHAYWDQAFIKISQATQHMYQRLMYQPALSKRMASIDDSKNTIKKG